VNGWKSKKTWKKRGTDFLIEVSCHSVDMPEEPCCFDSEGPYRWAVYAYIYPKHPLFGEFELDSIYQEQTSRMPFHGGCSYLRHHLMMSDAIEITSVQVGADYNHLHDDYYTRVSPDEADNVEYFQVWKDAEELFVYLEDQPK